ncbi:MAG: rhodanese-like domain-containing protein [Bdellovibrionales bacterium]|nr:rhodanese-like domain-containing protein [Bdellovibrionales bacterium]
MKHVAFESAKMNGEGVLDVSPQETLEKAKSVKLIDVRRPDEFVGELGHIDGATLVTLETELQKTLDTLSKDETYVFVCRSGARSTTASSLAQAKGFTSVYNMQGGMMAWNRAGLPITR